MYIRRTVFFAVITAVLSGLAFAGIGFTAEPLVLSHEFAGSGEIQPINWRLKLEFSSSVSVLELSRHLSLSFSGKTVSFNILNMKDISGSILETPLPSERPIFVIEPKNPPKESGKFTVTVKRTLKSSNGKHSLSSDSSIAFQVRKAVEISSIKPFFDDTDNRGVIVTTSEEISEPTLLKHIQILPPVGKLTVNRSGGSNVRMFKISGKFETGKNYRLCSRSGEIETGDLIFQQSTHDFIAKGPPPTIRFEIDRSVVELKSRQTVPLSLINLGQVRGEITRIPPFFAPEFNDLTVMAADDARRGQSGSELRASDSKEAEIAKAVREAEQRLIERVNHLAQIRSVMEIEPLDHMKLFLGNFDVNSESFFAEQKKDLKYQFSMPLSFRSDPQKGGAFLMQVSAPNDESVPDGADSIRPHAARLIQVTDLSITYKFSANRMLLWITSVETGAPVADVALMLFTKDDNRLLLGKTDKDGLLTAEQGISFDSMAGSKEGFEIRRTILNIPDAIAVVAAKADDSSYIMLDTNRFMPFSVRQATPGEGPKKNLNGHIFTERGIYKQGDKVFWKATLRKYEIASGTARSNADSILPPAGHEVEVTLYNSRDEVVDSDTYSLNEYGTCSGSYEISQYAPLGQYSIAVETKPLKLSNREVSWWDYLMGRADTNSEGKEPDNESFELARTGFQVQTFEPPRHFVTISTVPKVHKTTDIPGKIRNEEYLECTIEGKYYVGGPLRNAKMKWTAHLAPVSNEVGGFGGYLFGSDDTERTLIESGEAMLDAAGKYTLGLPIDKNALGGLFGIEISATVLDIDARPATALETYKPSHDFKVGMSRLPTSIVDGDEVRLSAIVLDKANKKLETGTVRLELFQKRWFYSQKRDAEGGIYYRWDCGWQRALSSRQIVRGGHADFELVFSDGGEFLAQLVFDTPETSYKVNRRITVGYSYESYEDEDGRQRRRSDSEVSLILSNDRAKINDVVNVDFALPRPAVSALVTCERDGLLEWKVIRVSDSAGSASINIKPQFRPNVFITVTAPCGRPRLPVYRSQLDAELPKTYYGYSELRVLDKLDALAISIGDSDSDNGNSDLRARPGEEKTLFFNVKNNRGKGAECEMAVCVVDEAVLALTGYMTPILNSLMNFSLPLSVFTGDLRFSLVTQEIYRYFATKVLTGGGMGSGAISADIDLRKDFRPVAYWNPALLTDSEGKAKISFKLPDTTTAYRIYAVAIDKGSTCQSAQRNMIVSKEFFLQPGLPRFLTSGDKAVFNLTACNKLEESGQADLSLTQASNVSARLVERKAEVAGYSNSTVKGDLEADNGPGKVCLIFSGKFGAFTDAIQSEFPVVSKFISAVKSQIGHFKNKTTIKVELPAGLDNIPAIDKSSIMKGTLALSISPWSKITPGLRYLLNYPYGCVEQTSSGIIPLAAIRKLIQSEVISGIKMETVDKFLESGITRLLSMQTSDGGFAYWQGSSTSSWWGTQYAVFALTISKQAGLSVPESNLKSAIKYIQEGVLNKESPKDYYNRGIMALSTVNLALNDAVKGDDLAAAIRKYDSLDEEGGALQLWAESLSKLKSSDKIKQQLAKMQSQLPPGVDSWYRSQPRYWAFLLLTVLQADSQSKRAHDLAGSLLSSVKSDGRWNSTADTGFCLYALANYFEMQKYDPSLQSKVKVLVSGQDPVEVSIGDKTSEIAIDMESFIADPEISLESDSGALINWSLQMAFPEPERTDDDLNHGFYVTKLITNLNGSDRINVGDIVKITLEFEDERSRSGKYGRYEYLALEDPLPAGFIAINTALKTESAPIEESDQDNEEWYTPWENGAYRFCPDHMEIHDDRVNAFRDSLWSNRFRFTYYARAVCEGTFTLRPSRVSLMYRPEFFGLTKAEEIVIHPAQ